MRIEKKTLLKDDGRYVVYYHFPQSATELRAESFASIDAPTCEILEAADSVSGILASDDGGKELSEAISGV